MRALTNEELSWVSGGTFSGMSESDDFEGFGGPPDVITVPGYRVRRRGGPNWYVIECNGECAPLERRNEIVCNLLADSSLKHSQNATALSQAAVASGTAGGVAAATVLAAEFGFIFGAGAAVLGLAAEDQNRKAYEASYVQSKLGC